VLFAIAKALNGRIFTRSEVYAFTSAALDIFALSGFCYYKSPVRIYLTQHEDSIEVANASVEAVTVDDKLVCHSSRAACGCALDCRGKGLIRQLARRSS
jgi:hypothetical protein